MEQKIPENSSSGPSHPAGHQEEQLPNKYQRWNIFLHSLEILHFNIRTVWWLQLTYYNHLTQQYIMKGAGKYF